MPSKQQPALSIPSPRVLSPPPPSTVASRRPIPPPPPSSQSFPGSRQSSFSAPVGAAFASSTRTSQQHATLVKRWHPNLPLIPPGLAAHLSRRPLPRPISTFPVASESLPQASSRRATFVDTATSQQRAPPVPVLREVPPRSPPTNEPPKSSQSPPPSSQAFPLAPSSQSHAPSKSAATTSMYPLQPTAPFTSSPRTFSPPVSPTSTPVKLRSVQPPPTYAQPHTPSRTPSAQYQTASPTHPLASQRRAPLIGPPRAIPPPVTLAPGPLTPTQYSPPQIRSFPPVPQSLPSASPPPASQQSAPLVPPPRCAQSSSAPTSADSTPPPTSPTPVRSRPFTLLRRKGDTRPAVQVFLPVCAAPIVEPPRDVPPPSTPTPVTPVSVQSPPPPAQAFPTPPEHVQPSQSSPIDATLDALAETITTLKRGVEALLGNPSSLGSGGEQHEDAPSRPERCRFCGSSAHAQEECEDVVKYILAGKCKRNVFGKVTLPSGGEVPREIRGRCLRERFDKYHSQYPDQQAAPAYLEMLTGVRKLAEQDTTRAALTAEEETPPEADTAPPTVSEAPKQPPHPAHPPCSPPASGKQNMSPQTTGRPRSAAMTFKAIIGAPGNLARPSWSQYKPAKTPEYKYIPRMRESNFLKECANFSVQVKTRPPKSDRGSKSEAPEARRSSGASRRPHKAPPRTMQVPGLRVQST